MNDLDSVYADCLDALKRGLLPVIVVHEDRLEQTNYAMSPDNLAAVLSPDIEFRRSLHAALVYCSAVL